MTWPFRTFSNLLVVATYFGYYRWSDPVERGNIYYAMCGALMVWVGLCCLKGWRLPTLACVLMMTEGAQQMVFGAVAPSQYLGADLGPAFMGEDFYRVAGSLALAGAVVLWLSRRQK